MKKTSPTLIAKRYATALFQAANEAKAQADIIAQAALLATALEDAQTAQNIANPALSRTSRLQVAVTLAKVVKAHKLLAGTLATMAQNGRLDAVSAMLAELATQAQAASGVVPLRVETAAPLSETQKTQLKSLVKSYAKASNVEITEVANPQLLGGFRAFFQGMVWEQSVRGRLARLSNALLSNIHNSSYVAK